jgi:hypothetical protein
LHGFGLPVRSKDEQMTIQKSSSRSTPGERWWALGTPTEWLRRWRRPSVADAGDSGPPTGGDLSVLDIDLTALESLPSIHWVTSRVDLPDAWRTQPDVRYQGGIANAAGRSAMQQ